MTKADTAKLFCKCLSCPCKKLARFLTSASESFLIVFSLSNVLMRNNIKHFAKFASQGHFLAWPEMCFAIYHMTFLAFTPWNQCGVSWVAAKVKFIETLTQDFRPKKPAKFFNNDEKTSPPESLLVSIASTPTRPFGVHVSLIWIWILTIQPVVFAGPVCRTENLDRTELDPTEV
jgi:hypothetical protein